MFLVDYHIHSKYSFDGREELKAICNQAIEQGMQEIAITDHCDLYKEKPYTYILDVPTLYNDLLEVAEIYKKRLNVKIGVELGQPQVNPSEAERFLKEYELDFVIGSVHNMENDIDIGDYCFEEMDCHDVYDRYLDWLIELATEYDYDVLGHITYPLRYMAKSGFCVDVIQYEEKVKELYKIIIRRNKGIELNTSGLYQDIQETMPSLAMLKWYKECGGEIITIGSDAHFLKYVGVPIREGVSILKEAGFRYITIFQKRIPKFVKI